MEYPFCGRIIKGVGGLYQVRLFDDAPIKAQLCERVVACRAKGSFRHENVTPLVGDIVSLEFEQTGESTRDAGAVISDIADRANSLIRPPLANLDIMFVAFAAAKPAPVLETVDKLICILEHHHITPVVVITKQDANPTYAKELCALYRKAGFDTFCTSSKDAFGIEEIRDYIAANCEGKISAFAGASGVGKSTLMNALFPTLSLDTGGLSEKISRGKHTTRRVELYEVEGGFVADTPGFSMLDFVRFDFFKKEDLPLAMREFEPYIGACRYTKCTHTKEEGCAILEAVREGKIAPSRHQGFLSMYEALKNKHDWSKK